MNEVDCSRPDRDVGSMLSGEEVERLREAGCPGTMRRFRHHVARDRHRCGWRPWPRRREGRSKGPEHRRHH